MRRDSENGPVNENLTGRSVSPRVKSKSAASPRLDLSSSGSGAVTSAS